MRKIQLAFFIVLMCFCFVLPVSATSKKVSTQANGKLSRVDINSFQSGEPANKVDSYVPGEILVKYKSSVRAEATALYEAKKKFKKLKTFKKSKIDHFRLPDDLTVEQAVEMMRMDPDVEFVQPNYIRHAVKTPNDPSFNKLWGLHNTGQSVNGSSGTSDADMDLPEAWDTTTGSDQVIVAVLDSGVDYNHPDLSANIWLNADEFENGSDSDGNGKTDDIRGWDFADEDNDPMDYSGHGSHCAGSIAAVGNNATGITGVAWNAKIMCLRVLDILGGGNDADIIEAIEYADANGADIISMSLGGTGGDGSALNAAISATSALFVCAAGNSGADNDSVPHWPSSCPANNIIAVAATDSDDDLASFSCYGATSVDVGGPGVNIYSTAPSRKTDFVDRFNDTSLSPWTSGGTNNTWQVTSEIGGISGGAYSLAVSPNGDYDNDTDAWVVSSVNLGNSSGSKLEFYIAGEAEYEYDGLLIEVSIDGGSSYEVIDAISGSTQGYWIFWETDLTPYAGYSNVRLRFRFLSDYSVTYTGYYIEDVIITSHDTVFTGSEFQYMNGTSMATPNVAGVAALVYSVRPDLANTQVKSIIEKSVDRIPALSGKCTANGRVNANKAILKAMGPDSIPLPGIQMLLLLDETP